MVASIRDKLKNNNMKQFEDAHGKAEQNMKRNKPLPMALLFGPSSPAFHLLSHHPLSYTNDRKRRTNLKKPLENTKC